MHALLLANGKLVGILFNREFEQQGPPFGGSKSQYEPMFEKDFILKPNQSELREPFPLKQGLKPAYDAVRHI